MDSLSFFLATSSVLALLGIGMQLWFAAGLLMLATSIFMAAGAFTSTYVSEVLGWPLPIAALIALIASAALALCLVPLLFRLTGIYLAMASLAASEIIRLVAINLEWLTGGADGRIVPRGISAQQAMLVAAVAFTLSWWLQRSTRGDRLELLRHDRRVAVSLGLPVRRWESSFFIVGALVTASAGVVFANFVRFTSPQQFGVHYAIDAIAIAVIGGRKSWTGPLFGVAVVAAVPYLFDLSAFWSEVLTGLLLIGALLVAPNGIAELVLPRIRRFVDRHSLEMTSRSAQIDTEDRVLVPLDDGARLPTLRVHDISYAYGGVLALDRVSFEVMSGEVVGIIGPNGAGKTTLLDACTGMVQISSGRVLVRDTEVSRPLEFARLGVRRTFQHVQLVESLTLLRNVRLGALLAGAGGGSTRIASRALSDVGLRDRIAVSPSTQPLGVRRLAELARVTSARPRLALLDEPSSGCDEPSVQRMEDAIRSLAAQSCAVILVSHDLRFVARVADRIVLMSRGQVVRELPVEHLESDEAVRQVYLGGVSA